MKKIKARLYFSVNITSILLIVSLFFPNPANSKNSHLKDDSVDKEIEDAQRILDYSGEIVQSTSFAYNKISSLTISSKANSQTLRNTEELIRYLKELLDDNLTGKIKDILVRLPETKSKLEEARNKLPSDSTDEQVKEQVKKDRERLGKKIDEIQPQIDLVNKNRDALNKKLEGIYGFVKTIYEDNSFNLSPLLNLIKLPDGTAVNADSEMLLRVLPTKFSNLSTAVDFQEKLNKDWENLASATSSLLALNEEQVSAKNKPVNEARDKVTVNVGDILARIKPWMDLLKGSVLKSNKDISDFIPKLIAKPEENYALANTKQKEANDLADSLEQISKDWIVVSSSLKQLTIVNFPDAEISKTIEEIETETKILNSFKVVLSDGTAGDMTNFTTEFIPLYYFTDTQNLMKALNPAMYEIRDVAGLREQAERLRRDLNEADILLVDAQAEVNVLQRKVENLREELRQSEARFLSSENLFTKASRRLTDLESRPDKDQGKIDRAKLEKTDRENERNADKANLDRIKNEQTGLPAKIQDAQNRLAQAQERVRRARTNTMLIAQTESVAFAEARDNEIIYVAPIVGGTTDPLKKVFMFAFGNRKMIYLRGAKDNVSKAKAAIALFDRPAPQARLTLWTMELNSTADYNGAKKFAKVLPIIENELANTRSRIATSLSYLRDSINNKVNEIAQKELEGIKKGQEKDRENLTDREIRWARMHFYQESVLLRLGFNFKAPTNPNPIADMMLPDPAGTTTLGEALVVLSLAGQKNRKEVLENFQKYLNTEFEKLGLPESVIDNKIATNGCPPNVSRNPSCWFASLNRAINGIYSEHSIYSYTSQQKEILDAIIKSNTLGTVNTLGFYLKDLKKAQEKRQKLSEEAEKAQAESKKDPTNKEKEKNFKNAQKAKSVASAEEDNLVDRIRPIMDWLYQEFNILPQKFTENETLSMNIFKKKANETETLRTANAQVARADLMLKQLIDAVDQDIDRHFVQPTIERLREMLVREKVVSVGVFNRTSVLSTNRLLARVDARASAQLPLGEQQDILQSVQQLAQIIQAGQIGGGLGLLGSLNSQPRNDATEIYGLTTQSQFKVAPIFDPTGQTLRFKFDYVAANLVTEPEGTTNPQLPRIERHTVNTEVELNNLELREISRFNTNSKLGLATRKWGGIPLIKDLPGMHYVPLLGWFTRKSGKSAVIQQSMIFGQTTMYPTIGDMLELLKNSDYSDIFSTEESNEKSVTIDKNLEDKFNTVPN